MKLFINPDGYTIKQDSISNECVAKTKGCSVSFCGVKIYGVVFVDADINLVRVSIPKEKQKAFESAAKPLFKDFKKLGNYDSGNTGYEFTVPNLEIKFF